MALEWGGCPLKKPPIPQIHTTISVHLYGITKLWNNEKTSKFGTWMCLPGIPNCKFSTFYKSKLQTLPKPHKNIQLPENKSTHIHFQKMQTDPQIQKKSITLEMHKFWVSELRSVGKKITT